MIQVSNPPPTRKTERRLFVSHLSLGGDVHRPCSGVGAEESHEGELCARCLSAPCGGAHQHVGVAVVELLEHLLAGAARHRVAEGNEFVCRLVQSIIIYTINNVYRLEGIFLNNSVLGFNEANVPKLKPCVYDTISESEVNPTQFLMPTCEATTNTLF